MRRLVLVFLMILMAGGAAAREAIPPYATPIAHYPLLSDGVDATGNNNDMFIDNAPFMSGGIYCNGIYTTQPGGFWICTPDIPALNFESFAVSVQFQIDRYPQVDEFSRPIIICGFGYRYLGARLFPDSTISMLYNNSHSVRTARKISLNVWHDLVLTYDAGAHHGNLYLDGEFICGETFNLEHGTDRNLGPCNPSDGSAFRGLIREIVVYDTAFDPLPVRGNTWGRVKNSFR